MAERLKSPVLLFKKILFGKKEKNGKLNKWMKGNHLWPYRWEGHPN